MNVYFTLALMVVGGGMFLYGFLKNKYIIWIVSLIPLIWGFVSYITLYLNQ